MSSFPPQTTVPPAWQEIGRSSPDEVAMWTTWVGPLGLGGDALYRSLIVADGAATITIDLYLDHRSRPQAIHRGRCDVPDDRVLAAACARIFLKATDEAVARGLEERGKVDLTEGHRRSFGYAAGTRHEDRHGRPAFHERERHLRERAYFLWEREGRPEGHASEYWERACREEAMAA